MSEMTVEQAVKTLNQFRFQDSDNWRSTHLGEMAVLYGDQGATYLTAFVAIAIAEKYEREKHAELDRAIAVLNKRCHRMSTQWKRIDRIFASDGPGAVGWLGDSAVLHVGPLYSFEVLAIADRYEKEVVK